MIWISKLSTCKQSCFLKFAKNVSAKSNLPVVIRLWLIFLMTYDWVFYLRAVINDSYQWKAAFWVSLYMCVLSLDVHNLNLVYFIQWYHHGMSTTVTAQGYGNKVNKVLLKFTYNYMNITFGWAIGVLFVNVINTGKLCHREKCHNGNCHSGERRMSRPFAHSGNLNFKHTLTNDLVFHNAWKRIICHFIT